MVTLDGRYEPGRSCRIEARCMKAACDSGTQSSRVNAEVEDNWAGFGSSLLTVFARRCPEENDFIPRLLRLARQK
uniref:Uncharacterized protein n=1 Tax=Stegastes partitus TaxID=144197 RepID=A0A3B4ZXS8_9TELE